MLFLEGHQQYTIWMHPLSNTFYSTCQLVIKVLKNLKYMRHIEITKTCSVGVPPGWRIFGWDLQCLVRLIKRISLHDNDYTKNRNDFPLPFWKMLCTYYHPVTTIRVYIDPQKLKKLLCYACQASSLPMLLCKQTPWSRAHTHSSTEH